MAYTRGSNTVHTRYACKGTPMAMNSGKLYAGVARRGAHAPATAASASASSSSSLLWSVVAAVAVLAAAAGVLGIPKYCVAVPSIMDVPLDYQIMDVPGSGKSLANLFYRQMVNTWARA